MKKKFYIILLLAMFSCKNNNIQYFRINANADTSIVVKRMSEVRTFMTVKVTGNLDSDCIVIIQQNNIPDNKVLKREFILKKGILNDTLSKDDLYDNSAKINFKHKDNKRGYINLEVLF